jgi:hypothetical protein
MFPQIIDVVVIYFQSLISTLQVDKHFQKIQKLNCFQCVSRKFSLRLNVSLNYAVCLDVLCSVVWNIYCITKSAGLLRK